MMYASERRLAPKFPALITIKALLPIFSQRAFRNEVLSIRLAWEAWPLSLPAKDTTESAAQQSCPSGQRT